MGADAAVAVLGLDGVGQVAAHALLALAVADKLNVAEVVGGGSDELAFAALFSALFGIFFNSYALIAVASGVVSQLGGALAVADVGGLVEVTVLDGAAFAAGHVAVGIKAVALGGAALCAEAADGMGASAVVAVVSDAAFPIDVAIGLILHKFGAVDVGQAVDVIVLKVFAFYC